MFRRIGWIFVLVGLASLAWLGYALWAGKPVNDYAFLGLLVLLLGLALTRRPGGGDVQSADRPPSPSNRRQNKAHKSWIEGGDNRR